MTGSGPQTCAAAIFSGAPPFPLFVIGFCVNGFGLGLQDAQANGFITRLPNATSRMSIAHAVYGLGALVSPIIATQFAKPDIKDWHFHYLCSVGLMSLNTLLLAYTYRGLHESELFAGQHYVPVVRAADPATEKVQTRVRIRMFSMVV
jgi:MFS family permease